MRLYLFSTIDCRSDIMVLKRQVESLQRQNEEILTKYENIIKHLGNEDGKENSFGKRLLLPVSCK